MPSQLEVLEIGPEHHQTWNDFTEISAQGSIFSTTTYLNACQSNYGILACFRGEEIVGGLVLSKSRWGKYTNPLLCKYLGILLHPFEGSQYQIVTNQRNVQQSLIEHIGKKRQFNYMFHPEYNDWLPWYWKGYSQTTKYTYRIGLKGKGDLSANFYSRLRGKINKISKAGNFSLRQDIPFIELFELLKKSFDKQKKKNPFDRDWLSVYVNDLMKTNSIHITGIEDGEGKLVSVLGIVMDPNAHYLVLNGLDHERIEGGQNELLIYKAIENAREHGCSVFDFEGSMIRNVESFYRQFGGELTPYYCISW